MTTFPNSPRLLKAGLVLVDPNNATPLRIITLQYNPDSLSRTLQAQAVKEGGDRSEATRLTGPPVETIKFDAEIDATDQLEHPDQNPDAVQYGIQPQLAALETIIYPDSNQLLANNEQRRSRHAGDFTDDRAASAVCLEQATGGAGADQRFQHHRRSLRHRAKPDPRQGQYRLAGVERHRLGL